MLRRALFLWGLLASVGALAQLPAPADLGRTVRATVVAFDEVVYYNRFGSVNPYAMIYALERDVAEIAHGGQPYERLPGLAGCPGAYRLRDGKRPRPLVLRGNVGDVLEITFG